MLDWEKVYQLRSIRLIQRGSYASATAVCPLCLKNFSNQGNCPYPIHGLEPIAVVRALGLENFPWKYGCEAHENPHE